MRGSYVLSLNGSFTSPPPPFTGTPLQFQAAQVARLTFDGAGQAWGEATLTFHNPAVPFAVRTRIALRANYTVDSNGHLVISVEESPLDVNGDPAPAISNTVTYECYIVQRRRLASCLLHTLISFQQGPDPRNLPVTMAGSLRRQY